MDVEMSAGQKIGVFLSFLIGWFIVYFMYKAYAVLRSRR